MGFSHNTGEPALAVLAHAVGDTGKPGLIFSQLTFTEIFLVTVWLETILALVMPIIAMRPERGFYV